MHEFGTTTCKKLIGVELSDPYELQVARDKGYFVERCAPLVEFCGDWLDRNLDPNQNAK
ncbi:MAG: hypothetical protein ACYC99_16905 [Candidatus Geothermincolia bacterium]